MKIVGYQIFLRITKFLAQVIRPDYQIFCLRSTPADCDAANCKVGPYSRNKDFESVMLSQPIVL